MVKSGIILPHIEMDQNSMGVIGDIRTLHNLKQALLYWEHVAAPLASTTYYDNYNQLVPTLSESGIVETCDLNIFPNGLIDGSAIPRASAAMVNYIQALRNRPGESWGIMPAGIEGDRIDKTANFFSIAGQSRQLLLKCSLQAALPSPAKDTQIDDILEFRDARLDQLRNVHDHINALAAKYSNLEDAEEPLLNAAAELEKSLDEYRRTAREKIAGLSFQGLSYVVAVAVGGIAMYHATPAVGLMLGVMAEKGGSIALSKIERAMPAFQSSGPLIYAAEAEKAFSE